MNTTRFELTAEKYNNFLKCILSLKDFCNDIDIKNGFIRQRSNDRVSAFDVDLTSILDGGNIVICDAKKKLNLLNSFFGQNVSIEIVEDANGYFILADQYSSIKFLTPTSVFVDNQYINQEELERIFTASDDDMILEYNIESILSERIKITTASFDTLTIQVYFNGDKAAITCATQAKDQFAKFVDNIDMNIDMDKGYSNITTIPFKIEHEDKICMKIYRDPNSPKIVLHKFETKLGDLPITIYSRSAIITEEEDTDNE
jgi:hypothetical protein